MNDTGFLKLLGYLRTIPLKEISKVHVTTDSSQENPVLVGRTCGTPDFADAEIANSNAKDLALAIEESDEGLCDCYISMHKKMLAAVTGDGSFPAGCNSKYPTRHVATYYVDRASFNAANYHRPVTDTELSQAAVYFRISAAESKSRFGQFTMMNLALKMLEEAYRRVGCGHFEIPDHDAANIHILTRALGGTTIGMAEFNNGTCGDHLNHWIDNNYRPGLMSFAHLLTHEAGHNNNLEHQFSNQNVHHSVMSYSPKQPYVGFAKNESDRPDDVSLPILRRYYGDEEFPPIDSPIPGPVQAPKFLGELDGDHNELGEVAFRGIIDVVIEEGQKPGVFRQIVAPGSAKGKFRFKPKNEV